MKLDGSTTRSSGPKPFPSDLRNDDMDKMQSNTTTDWMKSATSTTPTSTSASKPKFGSQFFYRLTHPALLNRKSVPNPTSPTNSSPFSTPGSEGHITRAASTPELGTRDTHGHVRAMATQGGRHFVITDEAVEAAMIL